MQRQNNFDGLRLIGALAVLFGHGFVLTGHLRELPRLLGFSIHSFGVYIFFSISGFLIAASWDRSRSLRAYWSARILRIFPALIAVVVISILLIGPLAARFPVSTYFAHPQTRTYLGNAWLQLSFSLPTAFEGQPDQSVNGSLWTLPVEFACYVGVPIALMLRSRITSLLALAAGLGAWIAVAVRPSLAPSVIDNIPTAAAAPLCASFIAASMIYVVRTRFPHILRTDVAVALITAYAVAISVPGVRPELIAWIALPYTILTIGLHSTPFLRSAARFGDLSYGLYLWAFPIQQLVIWRFGILPLWLNFTIVVPATALAAWVSWHALEVHAIRLRKIVARHPKVRVPLAAEPALVPAGIVDRSTTIDS